MPEMRTSGIPHRAKEADRNAKMWGLLGCSWTWIMFGPWTPVDARLSALERPLIETRMRNKNPVRYPRAYLLLPIHLLRRCP